MAKGVTVTEHILSKQKERPEATGAFTALLAELTVAAKIITQKVNKGNLTEDFSAVRTEDAVEEHYQKLVEFANATIINRVSHIGYLWCMASKKNTDLISIPAKYAKGDYVLIFDPLGGITNIDVDVTVGTVFSILKRQDVADMGVVASVLQPGREQVAAGYFIYGSSTMMVYTTGGLLLVGRKSPGRGRIFQDAGYQDRTSLLLALHRLFCGGFPPQSPQRRHTHVPGRFQRPP
jgi:fructose-1,6-bisphosphatase I